MFFSLNQSIIHNIAAILLRYHRRLVSVVGVFQPLQIYYDNGFFHQRIIFLLRIRHRQYNLVCVPNSVLLPLN
jgi:hypothetical protein